MIAAKQIHCGQYKRYGDFFRVWEIETDESKEAVLEYCFAELYKVKNRPAPSGEWHANIRYGGERFHDADYYFRGYYSIEQTPTGYKFTVCEPYCD